MDAAAGKPSKILLIHPNFPGQFRGIAPALVRLGYEVRGLGKQGIAAVGAAGVDVVHYKGGPFRKLGTNYPPLHLFSDGIRQGRSVRVVCERLRGDGYMPDVIIGHPGWGDMTFVRDVWPTSSIAAYLEYYYSHGSPDAVFDPEFPSDSPEREFWRLRNLHQVMAHEIADVCFTPTQWQRSLFPSSMRDHMEVIHEGVDTRRASPDAKVTFVLPGGRRLTRRDLVITYAARNLEPYRGFHSFMRALPQMQAKLPDAIFVVVGDDDVSYGRRPADGRVWREVMLDELGHSLDDSRIVWLPRLEYEQYLALLRVSTVHLYLTYPFVLSWSLLEAMATGCAIVASDTPPVREAIKDGVEGLLVDFFDKEALANRVVELGRSKVAREELGRNARRRVVECFDFRTRTIPAYQTLISQMLKVRETSETARG